MDNFNIFKPLLKKCPRAGIYYILAKEGCLKTFIADCTYSGGKKVLFKSMKDRVRESDRMLQCELLIYDCDLKICFRTNVSLPKK